MRNISHQFTGNKMVDNDFSSKKVSEESYLFITNDPIQLTIETFIIIQKGKLQTVCLDCLPFIDAVDCKLSKLVIEPILSGTCRTPSFTRNEQGEKKADAKTLTPSFLFLNLTHHSLDFSNSTVRLEADQATKRKPQFFCPFLGGERLIYYKKCCDIE